MLFIGRFLLLFCENCPWSDQMFLLSLRVVLNVKSPLRAAGGVSWYSWFLCPRDIPQFSSWTFGYQALCRSCCERLAQPSANLVWLQDKEFVPLLESWDQLFVANCAEWALQHVLEHEWALAGQGINAFNLEYGHRSCWSSSTAIKAGYKLHFCLCNYCSGSSKGVVWAVGAEESLCHVWCHSSLWEGHREALSHSDFKHTQFLHVHNATGHLYPTVSGSYLFLILEKDFFFRKKTNVIPFRWSFYSFDFNKNLPKMCYSGSL